MRIITSQKLAKWRRQLSISLSLHSSPPTSTQSSMWKRLCSIAMRGITPQLIPPLSFPERVKLVYCREVSARGLLFANFHNISGKWSPCVKPYIDLVHKTSERNLLMVRSFGRNPTAPSNQGTRFVAPRQAASTLVSSDEVDLSTDYLPYLAIIARKNPRFDKPRTPSPVLFLFEPAFQNAHGRLVGICGFAEYFLLHGPSSIFEP